MRKTWIRLAAACLIASAASTAALATDAQRGGGTNGLKRITAWGTSQQPNVVTQVVTSNATLRLIVRPTIAGDAVSFRLDNTFGTAPLAVGKAYVGPRIQGALVGPGTNRQATFGGVPSVVIPVGSSVSSDPVPMKVLAQQDLAISLYLPGVGVQASQHAQAVVTSYLTPDNAGDAAADENRTAFTLTTTTMPWVKSVDVYTRDAPGAIVAFGDSITDGTCTTLDAHDRWEDLLAVRLDTAITGGSSRPNDLRDWLERADARGGHKSVVNEGIGGNTVTRTGLQPPADSTPGIERLDRDVLSHSGVTDVVVFMGTNDIRREATAAQVIAGLTDIATRLKARGKRVIGVTIIPRHNVAPVGTNTGWNPAKTAIRNQVNQWIRTTRLFDDVLDFDRLVRDPANHDLLYPAFNCGDGIHPSPAGYYQMGKSVDLDLFDGRGRR